MKTKNLAIALAAGMLTLFTSAMLWQIQGMLPAIARVYIIVISIILALIGMAILAWLFKTIYLSLHTVALAHYEKIERQYELRERKERWEMEKRERETSIYIQRTRIQVVGGGTYIIRPETDILPQEQNVLMLPGAQSRAGRGELPARASSRDEEEKEIPLPTNVLYGDVRAQVPHGHILVGIGRNGLETRKWSVGACTWIVGLSGTGKTSTTVIRIEERKKMGYKFLGGDPHWFKDDSLTNALRGYEDDFLMPMAQTDEQLNVVLNTFIGEFMARKNGQRAKPFQKLTLAVDEVNSLTDLAAESTEAEELREENLKLLKSIVRICGQEARNFEMGGIFISQQATGLAWLRNKALMVIVHQLLMDSEKLLALNNDKTVAEEMKYWPVGRTYVYGVGFTDGPRTVQQPYLESQSDETRRTNYPQNDSEESSDYVDEDDVMEGLAPNPNREDAFFQAQQRKTREDYREDHGEEPRGKYTTGDLNNPLHLKKFLNEAGKMRTEGMSIDAILKTYDIPAGGRNNQNLKALLDAQDQGQEEVM